MNQNLKTIKYIVKEIQWRESRKAPMWFFSMHLPFMVTCILQVTHKKYHENLYFNHRIYDGLTRNDFKKGNLIAFLGKIKAIRQYTYEDDPDGRSYWIGSLDDD